MKLKRGKLKYFSKITKFDAILAFVIVAVLIVIAFIFENL